MSHNIFDHGPDELRRWAILRTNARSTDGPVKRNRRKGDQPEAPIVRLRKMDGGAVHAPLSSPASYPINDHQGDKMKHIILAAAATSLLSSGALAKS
jgi:hypothetical protein